MVKTKKQLNKQPKVKTKTAKRIRTQASRGLDKPAADWAKLIADPCTANLTNTIWPGTSGSIVSRFETDFIQFNAVTDTAGVLTFCPGSNGIFGFAASGDTSFGKLGANLGFGPGDAFLKTVASSFRCVAACMQVSFPGAELDRSGIVALGVHPLATLATNIVTGQGGQNLDTSPSYVRTLCQHTERMPGSMAEILWMPGPGDSDWWELNNAVPATGRLDEASGKNTLTLSVAGLPVSTGVRIRLVSVIEWLPRQAQGLVSTVQMPTSVNTINDVLRAIPASKGTSWFINAFAKAQPWLRAAGTAITYGSKMLGPALMAL